MDVVACDGFVGNIVLTTVEGYVGAIMHLLKEAIHDDDYGFWAKLASLLLLQVFKAWGEKWIMPTSAAFRCWELVGLYHLSRKFQN